MAVHDWTRVEPGIFHDFHTVWIAEIRNILNEGLLPSGYYALAEQHAGRAIADVLALHADGTTCEPPPISAGGIAVAEAPPRVRRKLVLAPAAVARRRTLAIRHVSGHRIVAMIEILSPANKDRAQHIDEFVAKAASALEQGIHLLLVDLFPPGPHDPRGIHGLLWERLGSDDPYDLPLEERLTLAAYAAGSQVDAYLEHFTVGATLPDMPLFLDPSRYINVPLDRSYEAAYRGTPAFWRAVLEGTSTL